MVVLFKLLCIPPIPQQQAKWGNPDIQQQFPDFPKPDEISHISSGFGSIQKSSKAAAPNLFLHHGVVYL